MQTKLECSFTNVGRVWQSHTRETSGTNISTHERMESRKTEKDERYGRIDVLFIQISSKH
jgi:hypothetical protein